MNRRAYWLLMLVAILLAGLTVAAQAELPRMKMTTPIPESISAPDKVETPIGTFEYFDGVPTQATVDVAYDFLDKPHGMQVFLSTLPSVSIYQIREG